MRAAATLTAEERHSTSTDLAPGYRLDAKGRQAAEDDRLSLLEQIFDPLSRRRRVLVQPGWRCLEVGAGRGVGAGGHVDDVAQSARVEGRRARSVSRSP